MRKIHMYYVDVGRQLEGSYFSVMAWIGLRVKLIIYVSFHSFIS